MKRGFSLVELAIVLAILGLLTGGILTGQNLIRAAELRAIHTEMQQYKTAIYAFNDKYDQWPGDFDEATRIWGEAAIGNACKTAIGSGTETCDGDGDGTIDDFGNAPAYSEETLRAWQHLANAGMIEGQFIGTHVANVYEIGRTLPKSRLGNGWYLGYEHTAWPFTSALSPASRNGHMFLFASQNVGGTGVPWGATVTPEEAWSMDTKIDDGIAGKGKMMAIYGEGNTQHDCNVGAPDFAYNLSNSSVVCHFKVFWD